MTFRTLTIVLCGLVGVVSLTQALGLAFVLVSGSGGITVSRAVAFELARLARSGSDLSRDPRREIPANFEVL